MDKYSLKAAKRSITGKKVKQLRAKGKLPANVYGNKIKSEAVEVSYADFKKVYSKARETKVVELVLGDKDSRPVLIHRVQLQPVSGAIVHADFYQVNLKEKVRTEVPVELTGVAPAVAQKMGLVLQTLNEVEVEALPGDLPEKIILDISTLDKVGAELKVGRLKVAKSVAILTDGEIVVVKVGALVTKEAEQMAAAEDAAAQAAKAEGQAQAAPAGEAVAAAGAVTQTSAAGASLNSVTEQKK